MLQISSPNFSLLLYWTVARPRNLPAVVLIPIYALIYLFFVSLNCKKTKINNQNDAETKYV